MTTCCAWCGSIQSVDLVRLVRSGLSHGICIVCMPGAFGREATLTFIKKDLKSAACLLCVNGLRTATLTATSDRSNCNHTNEALNA